jgi:hypothetical protein
VSQRTLLIVALGLMALGLLLGIGASVTGGSMVTQDSRQVQGPQQGPQYQQPGPGGFLPGQGGFRGGIRPGERIRRPLTPVAPASPKPTPSPTA